MRFACFMRDLTPELLKAICNRLRVPTDCKDLAELLVRERGNIQHSSELGASGLVKLLERCDAFRKPSVLQSCCWLLNVLMVTQRLVST